MIRTQPRRMALVAAGWLGLWALVVAIGATFSTRAEAMTAADIPAIPPEAVEVCETVRSTICPLVTIPAALWVTTPNTVDGWPPLYGRIVRFVADGTNGVPSAWVRLTRGGELLFPLDQLTLAAGGAR